MSYPNNGGKPIFHEFITPIGLFCHMNHDKPLLKTNETTRQPVLDANGIQEAEYRVTMAWDKSRLHGDLQDLVKLAHMVKAEAWPMSVQPNAFFALEPFFRDGDNPAHNTKRREYLLGKFYLNFKQKANGARNPQTNQVVYDGAPGLVGPYAEPIMPLDVWSGCTGVVSGIIFGSEYMGKNFISTRLNNIQLFEKGDRITAGGRPDPTQQFKPLKDGFQTGMLGSKLPNIL
jgi:hypothetical protein